MSRVFSVKAFSSPPAQAAAWGLVTFVVYAAGACPTIYVGDSGELVTAAYTLGIPHPSGYPLYVMLGKLWTLLLPIGSVAYRMSLLSAACAAATVGLLFHLVRRLDLHPVAAATAALLLAVSPSFWGEANVQRVYPLNALFAVLVLGAAMRWAREREHRWLVATYFLCGLGATNHTFMAIAALAVTVFVLVEDPTLLRRPRRWLAPGLAFSAGLLPYAYLPLRSRANPVLDWGDPETVSAFLDVVLRRGYWERAWIEGPWDAVAILFDYAKSLGDELLWAGAALAIVGVIAGRRQRWPVALPLLVMAGNLAAVGLHGSRSDIFIWHRYYIPSYVAAAFLAGLGCHHLINRLPAKLRWVPLLVPAIGFVLNWSSNDRSRYRIADDFSRRLLESLPPDATLAASDDNVLFPLIYLHWVEGVRPDVDLILQGVGSELPPLRFDPDVDAVFFTHHPNWRLPELRIVPYGLAFRVVRSGSKLPPPDVAFEPPAGTRDPSVPKDYLTQNLIGHHHSMLGFTLERSDWSRAREQFDLAARAAPQNDVLFYNLALVYARRGLVDEALDAFERSHAINPRRLASAGQVRAIERAAELRVELAQRRQGS